MPLAIPQTHSAFYPHRITSTCKCNFESDWCVHNGRQQQNKGIKISRKGGYEWKDSNKAESFFRINFYVYTDMDDRERARARDKTKNFVGGTTCPFFSGYDHFLAAMIKWEMLAASKVKMSGGGKKGEQEHKQQHFFASTSVQITLRAEATFSRCELAGKKRRKKIQTSITSKLYYQIRFIVVLKLKNEIRQRRSPAWNKLDAVVSRLCFKLMLWMTNGKTLVKFRS